MMRKALPTSARLSALAELTKDLAKKMPKQTREAILALSDINDPQAIIMTVFMLMKS